MYTRFWRCSRRYFSESVDSLISRTGSSHAPSLFSKLTRFTHLTHLWVGRVIRAFWERKGSETPAKTKKREREERTDGKGTENLMKTMYLWILSEISEVISKIFFKIRRFTHLTHRVISRASGIFSLLHSSHAREMSEASLYHECSSERRNTLGDS